MKLPKRACRNCGRFIAIAQMRNHHWRWNRCQPQPHADLAAYRELGEAMLRRDALRPGLNAVIVNLRDPEGY